MGILADLRPCKVDGEKVAFFHRWATVSRLVDHALVHDGDGGGVLYDIMGIVEDLEGRVETVRPERIRFTDRAPKTGVYEKTFNEIDRMFDDD